MISANVHATRVYSPAGVDPHICSMQRLKRCLWASSSGTRVRACVDQSTNMFLSSDQTTNAVVQDPGPLETLSGAITWRDFSGLVGSLGLRSACAIPAVGFPWEGIADVLSWLRVMHSLPVSAPCSPSSSQDGMQVTRRTKPNVSNVSDQSITTHYPSATTARARETSNPITHQKTTSHSQLIVSKSDQATIIPFHPAESTHKESVTIAPARNHVFSLATSHAQHETRLSKR